MIQARMMRACPHGAVGPCPFCPRRGLAGGASSTPDPTRSPTPQYIQSGPMVVNMTIPTILATSDPTVQSAYDARPENLQSTTQVLVAEPPMGADGLPEGYEPLPLYDPEEQAAAEAGRITSVSPGVADSGGSFIKSWGPPLAAVAAIGLAVWILRS